jgi:hypothetical protein
VYEHASALHRKADSNATPALPAAAINEIKQDGARKTDEQPVRPVR